MFSAIRTRAAGLVSAAALETSAVSTTGVATRGMAVSLSDLRKRITATGNVAQLTGVMKLVAASKLKGVETRLAAGRPFGVGLADSISFKNALSADDEEEEALPGAAKKKEDTVSEEDLIPKTHLFLILTTDRGLCGGVNSQITRYVRDEILRLEALGHTIKIFMCGEKGKSQMMRQFGENFVRVIDGAFDKDITFPLAAAIAERVVKEEYDSITMYYNEYENAAKFVLTERKCPRIAGLPVGTRPPLFQDYEVEPEDNEEALANMEEYAIAGMIYGALLETQTCEMASRMTAMDAATNNATDMVDSFTLQYNRARQAKITTELVEIISGAEALEAGDGDE